MMSGVPIGGGGGTVACTQRSEKVLFPGSVIVAAIAPANGKPTRNTESKGVGEEHAYTPTVEPTSS